MLVLRESRLMDRLIGLIGLIKVRWCLVRKVRVIAPAGAADPAAQERVLAADVRAESDQSRSGKQLGKSP
jgi:alkyl sulfatase BDS1-like metallo-beta-lactamase superfamily hydrolase